MIGKHRTFTFALAVALLMLLAVGSIASADGPYQNDQDGKVAGVCIHGVVINHREQPVDGTKTTPPLVVNLLDANGGTVATANVEADGYFKFEGLVEGEYNLSMQLPPGWEGIVPQARLEGVAETGLTQFDEVKGCHKVIFKIRRLVTIQVYKWEEQLDGTVIPGEDWKITATPVKDPFAKVVTITITNGQGSLTLTPGTWTVAETVKPGWTPVTPPVVTREIDQYDTGELNEIVFKNREPVCHPQITVTKVGYGTNANGDPEALGTLSGWKFTVSRADKGVPAITKVTGGDGRAVFDNLLPGVYKVEETVQTGWEVLGENPVTVTLMDCEEVDVTFENQELIGDLRITGKKLYKAWEEPYKGTLVGLPGWTITAKLVGTDAMTSTTTNALGEYEFTAEALSLAGMGFPGAAIKVCEEDRDDWVHVSPECVVVRFPYPVPPEYTGEVVDFVNVQEAVMKKDGYKDGHKPGYDCRAWHQVKPGDTLGKISGKYGAAMKGIIRANGIKNPDVIFLGQKLCIP